MTTDSVTIEVEATHDGRFRVVEFFPNGFFVIATLDDRDEAERMADAYRKGEGRYSKLLVALTESATGTRDPEAE